MESNKQDFLEKLYGTIAAVYYIHTDERRYEKVKADDALGGLLGESGTLEEAYNRLFMPDNGTTVDNVPYKVFMDLSVFLKENYRGNCKVSSDDGRAHYYDFRIAKIGQDANCMLFYSDEYGFESDQIERLKMETIQENFLFSMLCDLKNDTLRNSATTELNTNRQDFLNLKYSDWRYMISNMFMPDDRFMFLKISDPQYIIEHLEKEKSIRYEVQMLDMENKYKWVRLTFSGMRGFSRENPVFIYTVQDINEEMTRLLQQENIIAAVEEQNQKLNDINKAKTVFISNMSHELRTPINAVLGMDEMILRSTTDDKIRECASDIKNAGKMLLSIINDILDYSKIEAGRMEIIPAEFSLGYMIDDVNRLISVMAKEKGLEYIVDADPALPGRLIGDELRIKQVIVNILTNAVKYTPSGSVRFTVGSGGVSEGEAKISVTVKDTGIGMKQDEMASLFEDYRRLDEKRNRNIEGTGLGMSIVVRLLQQMGSELHVESEYGKGSEFSFELALPVADAAPVGDMTALHESRIREEMARQRFKANGERILVVDDNRVNLSVIEGLLKDSGLVIDCALNGRRALKMLDANQYDLIMLDHLMPDMDGMELLGHIRDKGGRYAALPVIALTANVSDDSRERYMQAGFSDFLEKPIVTSELERVLRTYLPGDGGE